MGKVISGLGMGLSGKVGNVIFSNHKDGTTTVRGYKKPVFGPASLKQLANYQKMAITSEFMKPVKEFIQTGYEQVAGKMFQNSNNVMVSHLRRDALIGSYPNQEIDYSKLLVTRGELKMPGDITVVRDEQGISFSWNPETQEPGMHFTDRVMMMAYFSGLKRAIYMIYGVQRQYGTDHLILREISSGSVAHVYISFIADDRKRISNSVYLGKLIC